MQVHLELGVSEGAVVTLNESLGELLLVVAVGAPPTFVSKEFPRQAALHFENLFQQSEQLCRR